MVTLRAIPVNAADTKTPEADIYNQAFEASVQKDYQGAVTLLEQLLTLYPQTQNEDAYWKLADIYDNALSEYQKAVPVYQTYLRRFPQGRFANTFQERLAYLGNNQKDWVALGEYQRILSDYYTRSGAENVKILEQFLMKHPDTILTPDIQMLLIREYFNDRKYRQVEVYIKKYLDAFPKSGKPEADKLNAYKTYSDIYRNTHQYRKAVAILQEGKIDKLIPPLYVEAMSSIKKEYNRWVGLGVAILFIALILGLMLFVQPWPKLAPLNIKSLIIGIVSIAVFTLASMAIVAKRGYGVDQTFPVLLCLSSVALIFIQWLAPVARKYNRLMYFIVSFILILAVIYISFYSTDRLPVFYQAPQFNQM